MEYVKNSFTGGEVFFHSSKKGIIGNIDPSFSYEDEKNKNNKKYDFGKAFYLGDKPKQTIALVNSCKTPKLYGFKIPSNALNEDNTLFLSKKEWMFYVLYNRGHLKEIVGTSFYEQIKELDKNKNFVVGPIADDVFSSCMKDFLNGVITDFMFLKLIDRYSYGTQIAVKSETAAVSLNKVLIHDITNFERADALNSRKLNRHEQEIDYLTARAELIATRKGKYLHEIFKEIREDNVGFIEYDERFDNLYFETEEGDEEYEFFR